MNNEIEERLLNELVQIIEQGKNQLTRQVNSTITTVYWQVGKRINDDVLNNQRAEYGKGIVSSVSAHLESKFGKSFNEKNVRRMMRFAEVFSAVEIVAPLVRQLSWSHFLLLLPIKNQEARLFYAKKSIEESLGKRDLQKQIEHKAYERSEIANIQVSLDMPELHSTFKDPYFLDFLGLKDGYLETDLESAIIKELENFILELGKGFTFVERQKRIILDGKDFYLDLLFFHRKLKRLVAIELKLRDFKPADKGQMELYLKWLDRYDRQDDENSPIGLILCAGKSTEQIELLQMHKDGIMVAEYWTDLPPKAELEKKLHSLLIEAKERIERRKSLNQ
jgi:predicted nuclease of restriction endonuclease-like (RecB) superfamily